MLTTLDLWKSRGVGRDVFFHCKCKSRSLEIVIVNERQRSRQRARSLPSVFRKSTIFQSFRSKVGQQIGVGHSTDLSVVDAHLCPICYSFYVYYFSLIQYIRSYISSHIILWDLSTLSVTNLSGVPTLGPPCSKPTCYCLSYATLCLTSNLRLTLSQLRRKLSEKLQTNSLYTPHHSYSYMCATSQHTSTSILAHNVPLTLYLNFVT